MTASVNESVRAGDEPSVRDSGPADPLLDTLDLFQGYVTSLGCQLAGSSDAPPALVSAFLTLSESVSKRIGRSARDYASRHQDTARRARAEERRRIARELHDRLGEALTVGLRQLDLCEIARTGEHDEAVTAREALTEAMRRLRLVTAGLRDEPVMSLEKALIDHLERVSPDAQVRLVVTGQETWAPPIVIDETFLVIREALRNALTHGDPRSVVVEITLTPYELRAWVDDDGQGFDYDGSVRPDSGGTGLATMRERAALLGGSLTISSKPGDGTGVELRVPLPGPRDEQPC